MPTAMKKITPSDLRKLAQDMVRTKTMPALDTVLQAIAEMRQKYANEIRARRRAKAQPGLVFYAILNPKIKERGNMSNTLQNHILVTNEDSGRKYLIPASMKPEFIECQDENTTEHEDDHDARMDKYLLTSEDTMALLVTELKNLPKKLSAKTRTRKK